LKNISQRKTILLDRELYQKPDHPFSITICAHDKIPLLNKFGELIFDTIDGAKPRFLNRGKKRRSVSTLSPSVVLGALSLSKGIPRASDRGVEGLIDLIAKWKSYTTHPIWEKGWKGKVVAKEFL